MVCFADSHTTEEYGANDFVPILFGAFEPSSSGVTPDLVLEAAGIKPSDEAYLAKKANVWLGISFAQGVIALFINNVRVKTGQDLTVYIQRLKAAQDNCTGIAGANQKQKQNGLL
jgi:hypothetical protein